jgi:hypothetical protein
MSQLTPQGRRRFAGTVLSMMLMLSAGLAASQLFGIGGGKNPTYRAFKDPAGRFELEYPAKDWKSLSLPSGSSSLAGFSHKDGPTLFVEHLRLDERMTPDEIAAMPEVELNRLKELQPKARDFKSDMVESKAGRGVLIRYARVGAEPESVMQYSILIGQQDLYRLNAIVSDKLLPKYESIVTYMIQSFMARPGA